MVSVGLEQHTYMHCVIRFSQPPRGGGQGPPHCGFRDEETEWREVSRLAQSQVARMCGVKGGLQVLTGVGAGRDLGVFFFLKVIPYFSGNFHIHALFVPTRKLKSEPFKNLPE